MRKCDDNITKLDEEIKEKGGDVNKKQWLLTILNTKNDRIAAKKASVQ
jgi:hypothetical protein